MPTLALMVYKNILRWATLIGLPISILLFFVDVLFRIQHWEKIPNMNGIGTILMLISLLCAWLYAILVKPPRPARPTFDFEPTKP